jgi:hypothetical protein
MRSGGATFPISASTPPRRGSEVEAKKAVPCRKGRDDLRVEDAVVAADELRASTSRRISAISTVTVGSARAGAR